MGRKYNVLNLIVFLTAGFLFVACGGSADRGTGQVEVSITDAPVDMAEAVVIHFIRAELHSDDGDFILPIEEDPSATEEGRSIDLLQLQGGQWTGLFNDIVTAGHYSWIRLTLDLDKSYIQINGQQYPLRCTSCENSSFKLNRSFNLERDGVMALMLDFDLRKSITNSSNGMEYILRPTLRVVETEVSGSISGQVHVNLITELGGTPGCSVYAFAGNDALLDDIYIPMNNRIPAGQNNPVSSANVEFSNAAYSYVLPFLPEGDYTIALTCDADNDSADTDDQLMFSDPQNVPVVAGETTTADFDLPMPVASP